MKTGEVIFVLLGRVEWNNRYKLGSLQVRAIELIEWHFVRLEFDALNPLLQIAHHQTLVQLLLLGEAGGIDRFKL